MKKILTFVTIAMCMLAVPQTTHAATSGYNRQTAVVGTVTARPSLNLRKSSVPTSVILLSIPKNTQVAVISKNSSNWYNITYNGKTGWVSGSYLTVKTIVVAPAVPKPAVATPSRPDVTKTIGVVTASPAPPVVAISSQASRGEPAQRIESRVMQVTAYSLGDKGMNDKGITANGEKALEGRTIAADSSIPFGTQIYIPQLGKTFTVTDRGGAIKGDRLDMYMENRKDAIKFGAPDLAVQIKY